MVFRLLENVFVSQIFTKPPRKTLLWVLTITPQAEEGLFFLKFVFPLQNRGERKLCNTRAGVLRGTGLQLSWNRILAQSILQNFWEKKFLWKATSTLQDIVVGIVNKKRAKFFSNN